MGESFLQLSGSCRGQLADEQGVELLPGSPAYPTATAQQRPTHVLEPLRHRLTGGLEVGAFCPAHFVHRLIQVRRDMEAIQHVLQDHPLCLGFSCSKEPSKATFSDLSAARQLQARAHSALFWSALRCWASSRRQLCWMCRQFAETVVYGTPTKCFAVIPVTSRQLKLQSLTLAKIRFNAFRMFFAPTAPKDFAFTSPAIKKKLQPAA